MSNYITEIKDIIIYSSDEDEPLMIQIELNKHTKKLKKIQKYKKSFKDANKKEKEALIK